MVGHPPVPVPVPVPCRSALRLTLLPPFSGDHFHHGLFLSPTDPFPAATRNLTDAILDLARLPPGATVLDAGCGVGGMARHLARRHGCRVTGFSLSAAQVALARRDSLAAAAVAVDDTAAIPLGDRGGSVAFEALDVDHMGARFAGHAFDAVVAVEAFSHFPHKSAFFAAAAEVVAAQGEDGPERRCLLVLSDFFKADGLHQQAVDTFLGPLTRSGFIPPLASPGECEEMARRAGWVLVTKEDLTAKVAKTM